MSSNILLVNNIQVDLCELIYNNQGYKPNNNDQALEAFLPQKNGNNTLVPLELLTVLLGFKERWTEEGQVFTLVRDDLEIICKLEKEMFISAQILEEYFNFTILWLDGETFSITDPLTIPYFSFFQKIYSIDMIHKIFWADLDGDQIKEIYIAYFKGHNLNLAAFTENGVWLYDNYVSGNSIYEMQSIDITNQKALVILYQAGVYANILELFILKGPKLVFLQGFYPPSCSEIVNEEIHNVLRCYDIAQHGLKYIYRWDDKVNSFQEVKEEVFYWFGDNCIDLTKPEEVARGFCQALALGLEEEALSYCSKKVKITFGEDDFCYSIRPVVISLRNIIEHFEIDPLSEEVNCLQTIIMHSSEERITILALYRNNSSECSVSDNNITRLVLNLVEGKWEILFINYLYNTHPTRIYWSSDLEFVPVGSVCTLYTCYQLQTNDYKNINLICRHQDSYEITKIHIDNCSILEISEMFPGVQIAFFREDSLRNCNLQFPLAIEVKIYSYDESTLSINVILPK